MRFYREKILLTLLEKLQAPVSDLQLQKLVFLLTDNQDTRAYDFMPYKLGCYSMQLSQDIKRLCAEGYITKTDNSDSNSSLYTISRTDLDISRFIIESDNHTVSRIAKRFGNFSADDLISYTYKNYPFFAINSIIAHNYLNETELMAVERARPRIAERGLLTIGYEGRSLEQYIMTLIQQDVRVLVDVRKNAYSQKFGFSRAFLEKACNGARIKYIHIPDLGIVSEKRKELNSQLDYDVLFSEYEKTVLKEQTTWLNYLYKLLQDHNRIALTCYEKDPNQCHRRRIADKLMSTVRCNYSLTHI